MHMRIEPWGKSTRDSSCAYDWGYAMYRAHALSYTQGVKYHVRGRLTASGWRYFVTNA